MSSLNPSLRLALISKAKAQKNLLQKGFTLVELLIVVVILGILTGVALPNFLKQADKARISGANTAAKSAASSYASLAAVGELNDFQLPAGLDIGDVACTGDTGDDKSGKTFTTLATKYTGLDTQAIATVCGTGVELTTSAAVN